MKERIGELLAGAATAKSELERHLGYVAVFRILIQHICVVLAEVATFHRIPRESGTGGPSPSFDLLNPSDGSFVTMACDLLLFVENECFPGVCKPIWKLHVGDRACWRLLEAREPHTVESLMRAFVTRRNDGIEGHGIIGANDVEAELDALRLIVEGVSHLLPRISDSGDAFVLQLPNSQRHPIKTLRPYSGHLICYRSIRRVAAGKCLVKAQIENGPFNRQEISYEIDDPFEPTRVHGAQRYGIEKTSRDDWSPLVLFPERLTTQFTGRERELEELAEWAEDVESRACMLWGDGGMGKTTLAVEFVHRLLDGSITSGYRPELITFYTAKKTRWGLNGLELIRLTDVGIADVATVIPRALDGRTLDKSWYTKDSDQLVQKLASYLVDDWGVDRNSHLLVIDNTETMATNAEEVRILAKQIRELSRRVGRVLLTSRRREAIEARQIEITKLSDEESVKFLRARASVLGRRSILDAGDRTLIKYSTNLGNKPLVLEVFVGALGEHGIGLENAFQRVQRMQSQDLGEFLYADAWRRLSVPMQHLLLLMTRVSDVHDDTLLKLCCGQVGIGVVTAYEALEESRGIAQVSTFENDTQILFSPEFLKYCSGRSVQIDGLEVPTSPSVDKVRSRYTEFLRSLSAKVSDRNDRAFRHALARAAYSAYRENRDDDCAAFYELAVGADPNNGWLCDRYAVFLAAKFPSRRAEALDWAKKATQLIPTDPDAWFTRGVIEGRQALTSEAIMSLTRAIGLGKPKHLCLLQMAHAHLADTPPNKALARKCLDDAASSEPKNDPLLWKYRGEASRLIQKVNSSN
jgi:tetratricopeptide (TPR) repeat protein